MAELAPLDPAVLPPGLRSRFVDGVNGPHEPGHIFNAVNAAGELLFWDAQREIDGSAWLDSARRS